MYKQMRSIILKRIEKNANLLPKMQQDNWEHHSTIKVAQQEKFITSQNMIYAQKTCEEYSTLNK